MGERSVEDIRRGRSSELICRLKWLKVVRKNACQNIVALEYTLPLCRIFPLGDDCHHLPLLLFLLLNPCSWTCCPCPNLRPNLRAREPQTYCDREREGEGEKEREREREGKKERERKSEWERVSDRQGKRKRLGLDEFISRLNNCSKRIRKQNTSILNVVIVVFWNRPVVFQRNPK